MYPYRYKGNQIPLITKFLRILYFHIQNHINRFTKEKNLSRIFEKTCFIPFRGTTYREINLKQNHNMFG